MSSKSQVIRISKHGPLSAVEVVALGDRFAYVDCGAALAAAGAEDLDGDEAAAATPTHPQQAPPIGQKDGVPKPARPCTSPRTAHTSAAAPLIVDGSNLAWNGRPPRQRVANRASRHWRRLSGHCGSSIPTATST